MICDLSRLRLGTTNFFSFIRLVFIQKGIVYALKFFFRDSTHFHAYHFSQFVFGASDDCFLSGHDPCQFRPVMVYPFPEKLYPDRVHHPHRTALQEVSVFPEIETFYSNQLKMLDCQTNFTRSYQIVVHI